MVKRRNLQKKTIVFLKIHFCLLNIGLKFFISIFLYHSNILLFLKNYGYISHLNHTLIIQEDVLLWSIFFLQLLKFCTFCKPVNAASSNESHLPVIFIAFYIADKLKLPISVINMNLIKTYSTDFKLTYVLFSKFNGFLLQLSWYSMSSSLRCSSTTPAHFNKGVWYLTFPNVNKSWNKSLEPCHSEWI